MVIHRLHFSNTDSKVKTDNVQEPEGIVEVLTQPLAVCFTRKKWSRKVTISVHETKLQPYSVLSV